MELKLSINSKNWVMIRPSGTEPIIRIYGESESQEKLDTLMSEYLQKVSQSFPITLLKPNSSMDEWRMNP